MSKVTQWRMLVTDDQEDVREVIDILFSAYDVAVLTAHNGREALEIARQEHPHFIISDIAMPEMDGWELLGALEQDPTTAHIPVVLLSAQGTGQDQRPVEGGRYRKYISKPFVPETFVELVASHLEADLPAFKTYVRSRAHPM